MITNNYSYHMVNNIYMIYSTIIMIIDIPYYNNTNYY